MIKFRMPLLAVRDVEISKKFYHDLFDQEVVLDLGGNVTFSGGFSVQQDFDRLTGVPKSTINNVIRGNYTTMKLSILHELCQGLGISLSTFFTSPVFDEENLDP